MTDSLSGRASGEPVVACNRTSIRQGALYPLAPVRLTTKECRQKAHAHDPAARAAGSRDPEEEEQGPRAEGSPQRRGVCTRVFTVTPLSPTRRCGRSLVSGSPRALRSPVTSPGKDTTCRSIRSCWCTAAVPKDLGGVRYTIVRGTLDTAGVKNRKQARSRYGVKKGGEWHARKGLPYAVIQPDPVYQNPLVTQLINRVLLSGKKTVAEHIVYDALEQISQKTAKTRRSRSSER